MEFKDKVVWITGASSGIGEGLVYAFAEMGCKLVISARREHELLRVKEQTKLSDENILVLPIDLEHYTLATSWVNMVVAKFGQIDILINNGGVSQKGLAMETDLSVEKKIMDINYFGNVALSKAVIPIMQNQKSGKIVITTSILGKFGLPLHSTYAASKHALYGFYDSLRMELKTDNIKILIVSPGVINTQASVNALKEDGKRLEKNSPAQINGMKTNVFAQKLISAIKSDKKHVYIGNKELLSVPFKLLFPNLFYKIMVKLNKGK